MPTVMPGTVTTLEIPERVVSHKKNPGFLVWYPPSFREWPEVSPPTLTMQNVELLVELHVKSSSTELKALEQ